MTVLVEVFFFCRTLYLVLGFASWFKWTYWLRFLGKVEQYWIIWHGMKLNCRISFNVLRIHRQYFAHLITRLYHCFCLRYIDVLQKINSHLTYIYICIYILSAVELFFHYIHIYILSSTDKDCCWFNERNVNVLKWIDLQINLNLVFWIYNFLN